MIEQMFLRYRKRARTMEESLNAIDQPFLGSKEFLTWKLLIPEATADSLATHWPCLLELNLALEKALSKFTCMVASWAESYVFGTRNILRV